MAKTTTAATTANGDTATKFAAAIKSRIDANVIDAFDTSYKASTSGAFQEALAAAQMLNLSFDELVEWNTKKGNPIEAVLDEMQFNMHSRARDCSAQIIAERNALLRLAVLAGTKQTRDLIEAIKNDKGESTYKDVPVYTFVSDDKAPELASRDAAANALGDKVFDARQAGDNEGATLFGRYVDAIDNPEKLVRLFKEQRNLSTQRSRWRNGFILHHINDLIENCATDNTLEIVNIWRDALGAANRARSKLVGAGNATGPALKDAIRLATREALDAAVKTAVSKVSIKKAVPVDDQIAAARAAVWRNMRKLSSLAPDKFGTENVRDLCKKLSAEYGEDLFKDQEEEDRLAELAKGKGTAATSSPLANAAATPPVAPASGTVTQKSEGAAATEATKPRRTSKTKQAFAAPAPEAPAPSLPDPTEE